VRDADGVWTFSGGHTIRVVDIPRLDIKGGHIRRRWLEGRSLRYLVPPSVVDLLDERADIVERCWGVRA
jgi:nicotinate-nucleotide adenylyltransferase